MNAAHLATVGLRIWAIMLFVQALQGAASLVSGLSGPNAALMRPMGLQSAVAIIVTLAVSVVLLWIAPALSAALIGNRDIEIGINAAQAFRIGVSLIGIYFLFIGLREASTIFYTMMSKPGWDETGSAEYLMDRQRDQLVHGVVSIAAGLALVFLRDVVTRWWSGAGRESDRPAIAPSVQ